MTSNALKRSSCFFFFQAEDGIRDLTVTGVQTCALPISPSIAAASVSPPRATKPAPLVTLTYGIAGPTRDTPRADRKSTTSELQSQSNLVCRLLLEKKKNQT